VRTLHLEQQIMHLRAGCLPAQPLDVSSELSLLASVLSLLSGIPPATH
jgi:hypothetical protein